ncbi:putative Homeodomain-like, Homeodomain-related, Homeobox protein, partial [Pseudoloma neurophilia]
MTKSGFFNSFHRNSHGELKTAFFDPFEVKHRKRTSKSQLKILEKTFESNKKPDSALRNQLSEQLGMTPRSVQVWFQNRRAKQKKTKNKPKYNQELERCYREEYLEPNENQNGYLTHQILMGLNN